MASLKRQGFTWGNRIMAMGGWEWYICPAMEHMECYFDQEGHRIGMSMQTWQTIESDQGRGTTEVEVMARNGATGLTFLVTEGKGPFSRSLLAEAKAKGLDEPAVKDLLTQVEERANGLIAQAAGIKDPTPTQMEIFTVRFTQLQREVEALQERIDKVRSVVELAGLAVAEAV